MVPATERRRSIPIGENRPEVLRKVFHSHLPAGPRSRAARFDITTTEGYRLSDRKMAGRRKANKRSWRKYQAEARKAWVLETRAS